MVHILIFMMLVIWGSYCAGYVFAKYRGIIKKGGKTRLHEELEHNQICTNLSSGNEPPVLFNVADNNIIDKIPIVIIGMTVALIPKGSILFCIFGATLLLVF